MKKKIYMSFFILVIAVICCVFPAAAEETHFTCDSDPSMLTGKTYDTLYLDVEGCGEKIILNNVKVKNTLIYNGGLDEKDHHIELRNGTEIWYMDLICAPSHQCHLLVDGNENANHIPLYALFAVPYGDEKGKIFVEGVPENHRYYNRIQTIHLWTNYFSDMEGLDGYAGLSLENLYIEKIFSNNFAHGSLIPSISFEKNSLVSFMFDYSPSMRLFSTSLFEENERPVIRTYAAEIDGVTKELSLDHVQIKIAHILGNNNKNSVFKLKTGYEKLHSNQMIPMMNLFLFGANLDFSGYNTPNKNRMDLVRLIVVEQPEDYDVNKEKDELFFTKYVRDSYYKQANFDTHTLKGYESLDVDSFCAFEEEGCGPTEYEKIMDLTSLNEWHKQNGAVRIFSKLSEKYAVNNPESTTHWQPYIDLSYVNVGKIICAKSISDEVSPLEMIHFVTESYTTMHKEPIRYVMTDGLTESLAEEPVYGGFEPLPGCHEYLYDPKTGVTYILD